MESKKLVDCFWDTVEISRNIESDLVKVYDEKYMSQTSSKIYKADIIVENITTYRAAYKFGCSQEKKTAVLNFANPVSPGGGVTVGAMAQEECLCRSSNLYMSINAPIAEKEFYFYHKYHDYNGFYSDKIIYSKDITVFKTDNDLPVIMDKSDWYKVDVITCSAPYLRHRIDIDKAYLKRVLKDRIKNIFEVATDNKVEVLILGAFGCGAFHNPPEIVAEAFRDVITDYIYGPFSKIVFAIKSTNMNNPELCPNINAFKYFLSDVLDNNITDHDIFYGSKSIRMPSGESIYFQREIELFTKLQRNNKYFGKRFSILGDSISTFHGFNPSGYNMFYDVDNCMKAAIESVNDTWWKQVVDFFGGELLVNNSWSGSRVTRISNEKKLFPSGCSDERTSGLDLDGVLPDIIIVFLGFNDWFYKAPIETGNENEDDSVFSYAYGLMLDKLKKNYPEADILCCTLPETYMEGIPSFVFPAGYMRENIINFNDVIEKVSVNKGCKTLNIASFNVPYDSFDGCHPTKLGMRMIACMILRRIIDLINIENRISDRYKYLNDFLDCRHHHKYIEIEDYYDATRVLGGIHVCVRCFNKHFGPIPDYTNPTDIVNVHYRMGKKIYRFYGSKEGNIIGNKYKLLRQMKGEQYHRFLGINVSTGESVFIKCLCANNTYENERLLLNEAKVLRKLIHPLIPRLIDVIKDTNNTYVVMEFIEGRTLEKNLELYGFQDEVVVAKWIVDVAKIMSFLHNSNPSIIYGDIQPKDIIVSSSNDIRLVNFNCSKVYGEKSYPWELSSLGVVGFAAPEQYNGISDYRTDIYSLGITIYKLLAGNVKIGLKFGNDNIPIRQINPLVSKKMERIIMKCTEKNPKKRYKNCEKLLSDLQQLIDKKYKK